MSCNIRIPLQQIIDDVAAALSDGFIKTDNAVLNEAVLNEVTIRGDISVDTAARNALCAILQTCGITAIELEWLDRPTVADMVAVSEVVAGEVVVSWKDLDTLIMEGIAGKVQTTDVVDSSGVSQEEINTDIRNELDQKTTRTFKKIADLVADTKLKNGQYVNTLSYNTTGDGGGAFYLVSNTATDYSIPLANDLHAVFSDSFDIRKFGIRDSATLDQSAELLRMRNYADSREYVIDFHGFSIMTPDILAGVAGGIQNIGAANGLWFENVHKIKNVVFYNDKAKRLNTGKCQLIFCPTVIPTTDKIFVLDNVTFDPWVDNYQAFTDDYAGQYDGMRHGFFIHPKNGWNTLFDVNQKDYSTNYHLVIKNVKFLSSAYSYNITQAGLRFRSVTVDGLHGDAILGLNLDCVELRVKNSSCNVRYDLVETGRLMVSDFFHYEPEHSGEYDTFKEGLIFNYDLIDLDNCRVTSISKEGLAKKSGQLVKTHPIGISHFKDIKINNCNGNAEFIGSTASYDNTEVTNCKDHIWVAYHQGATVGSVSIKNSIYGFKSPTNTLIGTFLTGAGTTVDTFEFKEVEFLDWIGYAEGKNLAKVNHFTLDNVKIPNTKTRSSFINNIEISNVEVINTDDDKIGAFLLRDIYDPKTIELSNLKLMGLTYSELITAKYTNAANGTVLNINDVKASKTSNVASFRLCGVVNQTNVESNVALSSTPPLDGSGTNAVIQNLLRVNYDTLTLVDEINTTVAANTTYKTSYAVDKDCKDLMLELNKDVPLIVGKYKVGNTYYFTLTNMTATAVVVDTLYVLRRQII